MFRTRTGVIRAVENVSFELAAGSRLALLGEPGAGKTTLGRLLARLDRPDRGRIVVEGREDTRLRGRSLRAWRQRVQYVYPDPRLALNSRQTLREILEEPRQFLRRGGADRQRGWLAKLCAALEINAYLLQKRPPALSTVLLQRVAIARALALRPALLICDGLGDTLEPGALRSLLNDLADLQQTGGFALIWTTRQPARIRDLADSVLVLYRGRAVEWGPSDSVLKTPQHPYARRWFGQPLQGDPDPQLYERGCRFHPECPQVMPVCREVPPELRTVLPEHRAACHLYLDELDRSGATEA